MKRTDCKALWSLIFLLGISLQPIEAQDGRSLASTLISKAVRERNDTSRAKIYTRLADVYIDIHLDSALVFADSSMMLAQRHGWTTGIGDAKLALGNVYSFNGNPEKALAVLREAFDIYSDAGKAQLAGTTTYAMGLAYERTSDYANALMCYLRALAIQENRNGAERDVAMCLSGISVIYFLQRDFKTSLDYSFRALQQKQKIGNATGVANELYNIGDTYMHTGDTALSVEYNTKALDAYRKLGNNMGQANVLSALGRLHMHDVRSALSYFAEARNIYNTWDEGGTSLALVDGQIGQVALRLLASRAEVPDSLMNAANLSPQHGRLLEQSVHLLQRAVAASMTIGDKDHEANFRAELSEAFRLKGNYAQAYINLQRSNHLHDSLYSQESKNEIARLQSARELALRDKEIALAKQSLVMERNRQLALTGGLLFTLLVGFLLYRQGRQRKASNAALLQANTALATANTSLAQANETKARFFGIVSHDLRAPVARLVTLMQLQRDAPDLMPSEKVQQQQHDIRQTSEQLLANMEDLLLWSKSQMEQFKPSFEMLQVKTLLLESRAAAALTSNIAIEVVCHDDLVIYTDKNFLRTILTNLVSNAVNALHGVADARIALLAERATNDEEIIISVTDNGTGIEKQAWVRIHAQEISSAKGGLGLHIVRDLATVLNASLNVTSSPAGTSFILTFRKF